MVNIRIVLVCLGLFCFPLYAGHNENEKSIDPTLALDMLLQGNERFINFEAQHPRQMAEQRQKTAKNGQKPFASVLTCSDSRVPVEILFDVGIGDVFVVRVAGNVADKCEIGSLEYGAAHLGTRLIVVMGHTKCCAVTAAVKKQDAGPCVAAIINKISPALEKVKAESKGLSEDAVILKAIRANVWQSVEEILESSEEIRNLVLEGKVKVVGALYDIQAGTVTNMGVHYNQAKILANYKNSKK